MTSAALTFIMVVLPVLIATVRHRNETGLLRAYLVNGLADPMHLELIP
jgi:hypothetical protein